MVRRPTKKKRAPLTDAEQSARFIEAAKKVEMGERPGEFDKVFKMIVKAEKPKKA